MDFKIISIILIAVIIVLAVTLLAVYFGVPELGDEITEVGASQQVDDAFGTPPEGFAPPAAPV